MLSVVAKRPRMLLTLDVDAPGPLYQQLFEQLKAQILAGNIKEGEKLPSIRSLTNDLGVSHVTVERAYLQLSVEGYVQNKPRSGYVVNPIDIAYFADAEEGEGDLQLANEALRKDPYKMNCLRGAESRYDFACANLQPGSFPRKTWARLTEKVLASFDEADLTAYRIGLEPCLLQQELSSYLRRYRGVACAPEQIVFQSGTEAALSAIMQLLGGQAQRVGHEEPGFEVMVAVAKRFGANLVPLPVDQDDEAYLQALEASNAQLVFATPSHQFPTGRLMPLEMRVRLLQWAHEHDAYIIEDDSCNEYRYDIQAIPSLHSLDQHNRVIYLGNFSKALSPGLRLSYLALPPRLLAQWYEKFTFSWDQVPYLSKQVVALFMQEGHWDQHLRRMSTGNKRRHDALVSALKEAFGDAISLSGVDSGMHLYVAVRNGMAQEQLMESAFEQGATVYGSDVYYWSGASHPDNSVLIGFSAIKLEDISAGVAALKKAWL